MNNLSKITTNYAEKRGLEVTLYNAELHIHPDLDGNEAVVIYTANDDGSFIFKSNISLPQEVKEELPYWIANEIYLRKVINFVSSELVA